MLGSLLGQQPKSVTIAKRSLERALALAERYSDLGDVQGASLDAAASRGPFDLVINATAAGLNAQVPAIPDDCLAEGGWVYDMLYADEPTRFMRSSFHTLLDNFGNQCCCNQLPKCRVSSCCFQRLRCFLPVEVVDVIGIVNKW